MLSRGGDGAALTITLDAPKALPDLPAAVELAVYRIATEALTNVVRHSSATAAEVHLGIDGDTLRLAVHDNGTNNLDGVDGWPSPNSRSLAAPKPSSRPAPPASAASRTPL
jgi:nitrate/nitrite-specific signal transduction histidine kinase